MCTECIAEHYGHKFFKYEHSGIKCFDKIVSL